MDKEHKNIILTPSYNLIEYTADIILKDKHFESLVVFPGKRPGHFLRKTLLQKGDVSPQTIFSMDEFIEDAFKKIGPGFQDITPLDAISIILKIQPFGMKGENTIESFIPWGFKIFSDFEQMYIENTKTRKIREIETILDETFPEQIKERFGNFSACYEKFYQYILENKKATRSFKYKEISEQIQPALLKRFKNIIFAGFFALTDCEKTIFDKIKTLDNSTFIFQKSESLGKMFKVAESGYISDTNDTEPVFHFYRAFDVHSQIFELKKHFSQKSYPSADRQGAPSDVICIPSVQTLFPLLQYVLLPGKIKHNISMGYPLFRTPLFLLLNILKNTIQTMQSVRIEQTSKGKEEQVFVPQYLLFVLHPYIKNIYLKQSSTASRIIFHTIEDCLIDNGNRFIGLDSIENDEKILKTSYEKIKNALIKEIEYEDIKKHLREIHSTALKPFFRIVNIRDFSEKIQSLIYFISKQSPINYHPYAVEFIKTAIEALEDLKINLLSEERFSYIEGYFSLLENYIKTINIPFEGTPLEGLQVLGFLETRNIKFENVYILDVNEGVIPDTKKEDTILTHSIRKYLGLPTYEQREIISKHYLDTLMLSSKNVHIFYIENKDKEKSRFVEQIIWNIQKQAQSIEVANCKDIFLPVQFSQKNTEPIKKNKDYIDFLLNFKFSPSSIDTYLHCPVQFFYQYILKISEKEIIGEIEKKHIGSAVHRILNIFFTPRKLKPLVIGEEDYKQIQQITDIVFEEEYGKSIEGRLYLIKMQIKKRMTDYLKYVQSGKEKIVIQECEKLYYAGIKINSKTITLKGKIDRVDRRDNAIFIIDYKTGSTVKIPNKKFSITERETWAKTLNSIQLPFYIFLFLENNKIHNIENINSLLVELSRADIEEKMLFENKQVRSIREQIFQQYKEAISQLIEEILQPGIDFYPTQNPEKECPNCVFKTICSKQYL